MMNAPLLIEVVVAFMLAAFLLHKYGDWRKQNAVVIFAVLISWYFSILTVLVLPLDISSTVYRQCVQSSLQIQNLTSQMQNSTSQITQDVLKCKEPWSYISEEVLPKFWRIVYWSSQFLTWLLLPLMQSYSRAGEFTFYEKLKSAVKDNLIYYASYLSLCIIFLAYIVLHTHEPLDWARVKAIASSASNTWGLFLLIILLGYAFVDVPRKLWVTSSPELRLQKCYFQLSKLNSDFEEAEVELKDIVQKIYVTESQLLQEDPLMCYVRKIFRVIPSQFHKTMMKYHIKRPEIPGPKPTINTLVQHHKQLKKALHIYRRTEIQRLKMFDRIYELQRIVADRKGGLHKDVSVLGPAKFTQQWRTFVYEYWWQAISKPHLLKVLSIVCGIMSLIIVWSEATFFNKHPVLSVFAIFTNYAKQNYNYFLIEILCALVIAYMCYCAYSTIFQIKLFNYYHFASDHQTDENSLIFSGMLLCRLTPPLCLNFLGLIHMDSHVIRSRILETSYTQVMGHMDVLWIISNGFNVYFPMVMLLVSVLTYLNVGSILLSVVGIQQYLEDSEITEDTIADGQRRAAAEKERRYRKGLLAADELQRTYSSSVQDTPPIVNAVRYSSDRILRDDRFSRDDSFEMDTGGFDITNVRSSRPSRNIFDDI